MSEPLLHPHQATLVEAVFRATKRIADRVTDIARDLVFLDSGAIEELG